MLSSLNVSQLCFFLESDCSLRTIWLFTAKTSNVVEPECVVLFLMYDMILPMFSFKNKTLPYV